MKYFKTIILASILCSSAFASEAKLVSITLEENREIIIAKEIKEVSFNSYKELDRVELLDGSIFYDTEIKDITFKAPHAPKRTLPVFGVKMSNMIQVLGRFVSGGDGSGGG